MTSRSIEVPAFRVQALLSLNIAITSKFLSHQYVSMAWEAAAIASRDHPRFVAGVLAASIQDLVRSLPAGDVFTAVTSSSHMTPLLGTDLAPPHSHRHETDPALAALTGGFHDESAKLIQCSRQSPDLELVTRIESDLLDPHIGFRVVVDSVRWLLWRRNAYIGDDAWGPLVVPFHVGRHAQDSFSSSVRESFAMDGRITGDEWN